MTTESIFVSYSSKDRPFAVELVKELQKLGANIWIDQLGIGLGENWDDAIEEALEKSKTFLILLSPTSVESRNVKDEINIAINLDKKLVPVLIKQCDLPMRLQRRQYADLINDREKAIGDILTFLNIKDKATINLKNILNHVGISEAPSKTHEKDVDLEDLLVSESEFNRATLMHQRGIKKNWQLIISVTAGTLLLLVGLLLINTSIPDGMVIIGSLSLNLLSIKPYGGIKKRIRNIDLMGLLKLKRERLIRIINKLTDTDIENFNNEFDKNIAI